jgi:hypothetical protein
MKFRYEFDIKKLPWPINHQHKLLLIGSCFTENIGEKLKKHKFSVIENPHGILFNPVSVADAIDDYIQNKEYSKTDLFYLNEAWHSWKHHSRFSGLTEAEALEKINGSISQCHSYLKKADYAFITLGSAWVYRLTEKALNGIPGAVAANNHKAPADWFKRELLKNAELSSELEVMVSKLLQFNPGLKVIFTISPVRHLREGVIDNNRSKALLIQAVHELTEQWEQVYYFPAYELVLDDLRDYRYYSEDLVHPNYFATQYVWERFIEASMTGETKSLIKEIHTINLAFQHKPFNPTSEQHRKFLDIYVRKAKTLMETYPFLDMQREINYFQGKGDLDC